MNGYRRVFFALLCAIALTAHAAERDLSTVEIKATRYTDNFYTLDGEGGRIGVLAGPDGVLMVDSQFAPLTDKIVAAVRQISDKPIRLLINTPCTAITPAATRTSARWASLSWRARTSVRGSRSRTRRSSRRPPSRCR